MEISTEILEKLADRCIQACNKKGWERNWSNGGCYLHLESSEFIEALRGKGEPYSEAADVLFVLLAMFRHHDMHIPNVFQSLDDLLISLGQE